MKNYIKVLRKFCY